MPDHTIKELKPCPFCGGTAELFENGSDVNYGQVSIQCQECLATGEYFDLDESNRKEKAITVWNRRYNA